MGTRSHAFAASGTPTHVQHSETLETGTLYLVTSVRVSKTFPHSPELRSWASGCGCIVDHPLENRNTVHLGELPSTLAKLPVLLSRELCDTISHVEKAEQKFCCG